VLEQVLVGPPPAHRAETVDVAETGREQLVAGAHEMGFPRLQATGVVAVPRIESFQDLEQSPHVLRGPSVNEIEVQGQDGGPAEHTRHHPDDDELDLVRGEPAEKLSEPRLFH
jgi:hypothetical protein